VYCSVKKAAVLCENHRQSRKFELAHLKKKKKKKKEKHFGHLVTFAMLFSATAWVFFFFVMRTLEDER